MAIQRHCRVRLVIGRAHAARCALAWIALSACDESKREPAAEPLQLTDSSIDALTQPRDGNPLIAGEVIVR